MTKDVLKQNCKYGQHCNIVFPLPHYNIKRVALKMDSQTPLLCKSTGIPIRIQKYCPKIKICSSESKLVRLSIREKYEESIFSSHYIRFLVPIFLQNKFMFCSKMVVFLPDTSDYWVTLGIISNCLKY
jgi:hypothetical protein